MLLAVLNKSWRQHPAKQQLYGYLQSITKTMQVRRTSNAGYCWRSKDEIISDVLQWTPSHGRSARTYTQHLCTDTGCSLENLPGAMDYSDGWHERVREICASCATWWGWWWHYKQKLAQKEYKTGHNWVGKVIHWELRKRLKFPNEYMHILESVQEKETHTIS